MSRAIYIAFYMTCCLIGVGLFAIDSDYDPHATLAPEEPPPPQVLGIHFLDSTYSVDKVFKDMGMEVLDEKKEPDHIVKKWYQGIPEGVYVRSGHTEAIFHQGKLIDLALYLEPNYPNFLLVRSHLQAAMGSRYSIVREEEVIEPHLKILLSQLDTNSFSSKDDELVTRSMERGKTFWLYQIEDMQKKVSLSYMYRMPRNGGDHPVLLIRYRFLPALDKLNEKMVESANKILPE